MSPPTMTTAASVAAASPACAPASGPSKATGSWIRRTSSGTAGVAPGAPTTMISVRDGPDGVDGVAEERPAVDGFGQLVAPEPARSAAGEDHDRNARAGHGARDPGT